MREIRLSGSEGGGRARSPYPYLDGLHLAGIQRHILLER